MMFRKTTFFFPTVLAVILTAAFFVSGAFAEAEAVTAADAAQLLRSKDKALDWTGNGKIGPNDAKAILLCATGRLDSKEQLQDALKDSLLQEKYLEEFSYNQTVQKGHNYYSPNVSITVTTKRVVSNTDKNVVCHIADIYLRSIFSFRTALANNAYQQSDTVKNMAKRNDALLAVNGDYCSQRIAGTIIRNGVTYREHRAKQRDTCAILYDGSMKLYPAGTYETGEFDKENVYQSWCFGPILLDENGRAKQGRDFNTKVFHTNPRCVLGYYCPGHYCLVVVDGRGKNGSYGLDMDGLAILMEELGCRKAYNMDGGATAVMISAAGMVNKQSDRSRKCSDIIYIIDSRENPVGSSLQKTDTGNAGTGDSDA